MPEVMYYIWSAKHDLWWLPNHRGYTPDLAKAGLYNLSQAIAIEENSRMAGLFSEVSVKIPESRMEAEK